MFSALSFQGRQTPFTRDTDNKRNTRVRTTRVSRCVVTCEKSDVPYTSRTRTTRRHTPVDTPVPVLFVTWLPAVCTGYRFTRLGQTMSTCVMLRVNCTRVLRQRARRYRLGELEIIYFVGNKCFREIDVIEREENIFDARTMWFLYIFNDCPMVIPNHE